MGAGGRRNSSASTGDARPASKSPGKGVGTSPANPPALTGVVANVRKRSGLRVWNWTGGPPLTDCGKAAVGSGGTSDDAWVREVDGARDDGCRSRPNESNMDPTPGMGVVPVDVGLGSKWLFSMNQGVPGGSSGLSADSTVPPDASPHEGSMRFAQSTGRTAEEGHTVGEAARSRCAACWGAPIVAGS